MKKQTRLQKLEAFRFRYFSRSTLDNDDDNWLRYVVAIAMLVPAAIGVVFDLTGQRVEAVIWFCIFTGLLVGFAVVWIVVWFYHNWRLRHESKK